MPILSPLSRRNYSDVCDFVMRYEPYCVSLADEVKLQEEDVFVLEAEGRISAVIHAGATLFHCIPKIKSSLCAPIAQFLERRAKEGHITQCINGEAESTAFLDGILGTLGQKAQEKRHYLLLTASPHSPLNTQHSTLAAIAASPPPCGLKIVRCANTASQADALMPLQIAYVKEEVIPRCRPFSAPATRLALEETLRKERVAALVDGNGSPVSKVSLNAAAFTCVQLGGVYTLPQWRGRGCATALVGGVTRAMLQAGRQVVLYVREENTAAIRLYRRLGYTAVGRFSIVYY